MGLRPKYLYLNGPGKWSLVDLIRVSDVYIHSTVSPTRHHLVQGPMIRARASWSRFSNRSFCSKFHIPIDKNSNNCRINGDSTVESDLRSYNEAYKQRNNWNFMISSLNLPRKRNLGIHFSSLSSSSLVVWSVYTSSSLWFFKFFWGILSSCCVHICKMGLN